MSLNTIDTVYFVIAMNIKSFKFFQAFGIEFAEKVSGACIKRRTKKTS